MAKLCDRCPAAGGCLLNYLGAACRKNREQAGFYSKPNRLELLSDMDMATAALYLEPLTKLEPGRIEAWLKEEF